MAKKLLTVFNLAFSIFVFSISLLGNDYTISIESSNDLNVWETIHTTTVESEADSTFYRALIEPISTPISALESTILTVTQTWSQETNYSRTAHVQVPDLNAESYPVILFLHGAGGSGINMLNRYGNDFNNFIKVGMDGYQNKWNIKTEPTKADDISFLKAITLLNTPLIISASFDHTWKLTPIDITNNQLGQPITFQAHSGWITSAVYHEPTNQLVTAGNDKNLFYWQINLEEIVKNFNKI